MSHLVMLESHRSQEVGVALLDRPSDIHGPGIAAKSGGEAFAFDSTADLVEEGACIWVLSSEADALDEKIGRDPSHLRGSGYFCIGPEELADEMGVPRDDKKPRAKIASEVFSRAIKRANDWYPCTTEDSQSTFAERLKSKIDNGYARSIDGPQEIVDAINQMLCRPAKPNVIRKGEEEVVKAISMHRTSHAANAMGMPVPCGKWVEIDVAEIKDAREYLEAAMDKRPIIAQITIDNPPLFALGVLPVEVLRGIPAWYAHSELVVLSNFAEIRLKRVFEAEEYIQIQSTLRSPIPRFEAVDYASISSGIFAEGLLAAVSTPEPYMLDKNGKRHQTHRSARVAFVASAARASVLLEAGHFAMRGLKVIGYDVSKVWVAFKPEQRPVIDEVIAEREYLINPGPESWAFAIRSANRSAE